MSGLTSKSARIICILSALLSAEPSLAQQSVIAGLQQQIKSSSGIEQLNVILELALWQSLQSRELEEQTIEKGLALARSLQQLRFEADFLLLSAGADGKKQQFQSADDKCEQALTLYGDSETTWGRAKYELAQAKLALQPGRMDLQASRDRLNFFTDNPPETFPAEIELEYRYLRQALYTYVGDPRGALEETLKGLNIAEQHGLAAIGFRLRFA